MRGMAMTDEFDKWFDEAGWKTGLPAKSLRPVWNNIKTWQNHIVDANKKVAPAALSTRKPYGYGIVDSES